MYYCKLSFFNCCSTIILKELLLLLICIFFALGDLKSELLWSLIPKQKKLESPPSKRSSKLGRRQKGDSEKSCRSGQRISHRPLLKFLSVSRSPAFPINLLQAHKHLTILACIVFSDEYSQKLPEKSIKRYQKISEGIIRYKMYQKVS